MSIVYCSGYDVVNTTFTGRTDIKKVDCLNKPWNNNSMVSAFSECYNLSIVKNINENVVNMSNTFRNCYNLINILEIPNNVMDISYCFYNCSNLTEMSEIPDSVINMSSTFSNCFMLKYPSDLSLNVNDISSLYNNCNNLLLSSEIPNSVTNMYETFAGCANLAGDIEINSENISNATNCFINTSANKDVYIPFKNNDVYTETYNSFINAGYSTTERVNGALLMDLNGPDIDLSDYEYNVDEQNDVTLTKYIGTKTIITTPHV